ncbi:hypothetical protein [Staphylococcus equorum]|uniref:Uncharacterized protein n=1 Tax=Staphylococcus equorum TaxID=246432 RepID=A0AAP7IG44_9STAP|nr:hypothetical protein [Staphylococcus equorum]OEK58946.1 hypothetical protein ASS94_01065 [Staphylococcus equorum]
MLDVKESIEKRKKEGKSLIKFQVIGSKEKLGITGQLDELGYEYEVYDLRESGMVETPYNILVGI